ncbi:hypothetical protein [Pseudomonas helleri]
MGVSVMPVREAVHRLVAERRWRWRLIDIFGYRC